MAHPAAVIQNRDATWNNAPTAGLLGLLAAPAIPRDTLSAGLGQLSDSGVAPLLERLAHHRIDGLAFRALSRLPKGIVDPWLRATLKRRHQRCAATTIVHGMAMAEVLQSLTQTGIPAAVLGGLRSVESIYGDAGSRPIEGHNLLVLPADLTPAAATFQRIGFQPSGGGLFHRGGMLVNLRTDAFEPGYRRRRRPIFPLPAAKLMERAVPGQVAGAPAMMLSAEDELLLLAVEAVRGSFGRLIGIADLAHLIAAQGCALDWELIRERAVASNTKSLLDLALNSTSLLGISPPLPCQLVGSARWLESLLLRRVRASRPLPIGGEILVALSAPHFVAGLRCLVDALLHTSQSDIVRRHSRAKSISRGVVTIRPVGSPHRREEKSAHGR